MQRNGSHSSDGTSGPSRSVYRKNAKDQADVKMKGTMKLPIRSSARESASRAGSVHGVADESSGDDPSPRPRRRGHGYRHVQARENARMHLGDDTYITTQNVYSSKKRHPDDAEDEKKIDMLDALAFEHMGTRLASISAAQDQTCRWLFDTSEYVKWRKGFRRSRHRFLWIKGKPGSGKSTLMATAFQQASHDFERSVLASFFFNARGDKLGRTTEGMYRSLLHQIFSQLPELPPGIPLQVSPSLRRRGWALSMLQNILRTTILHLNHTQSLVCYIDALDECAEADIRDALQHLEELRDLAKARNIKFLICFASRHYPNITIRHHRAVNLDEQTEHRHDISKYISSTLRVPGSLGVELHDALLDRCRNVFLWAVLTVKSLNQLDDRGGTRSELRSQMRDTPTEVQDLFRELLQDEDECLLPILQWILYARRALYTEELYFAVMAGTGRLTTGVWDRAEIDQASMQKFLKASSRGLLEFWEEEEGSLQTGEPLIQVQLIHESLREYLFTSGLLALDPSMGSRVDAISHARLAQCCLYYVAADSAQYIEENVHRSDFADKSPLLKYIFRNVAKHLEIAYAGNVLRDSTLERYANLWLTCKLDRLAQNAQDDCAALLYFSLVRHGHRYRKEDFRTLQAPPLLNSLDIVILGRQLTVWHNSSPRSLVLQAAARASHLDLAQLFHDRSSSLDFHTLIEAALVQSAIEGNDHILDLLLTFVATDKTRLAHELLRIAALKLQESTTALLLRHGADPSQSTGLILSSLARADDPVRYGGEHNPVNARIAIASMLLDHGADTKGAVLSASRAGRSRLAALLAARGATISRSAVRTAQKKGRKKILDIFDEAGAPIGDSADDSAFTSDASTAAVYQW